MEVIIFCITLSLMLSVILVVMGITIGSAIEHERFNERMDKNKCHKCDHSNFNNNDSDH